MKLLLLLLLTYQEIEPIDFTANVVVVDRTVRVSTVHVEPHQTLIMRPGAEIIFDDVADSGLHVNGTWRTEGDESMVIRSANPMGWRGHVHCGLGCDVDISWIEFRDLGRTDKSIPISKVTNAPGRYALHFHRTGPFKKHFVRNCKSVRSKSWAFVNHSSHVDFVNCVAEDSFGAAFVAEAGNAQGGFYRCIANRVDGLPFRGILNAKGKYTGGKVDEILQMTRRGDIARHGHGFWSDAPQINIVDCQVHHSKTQAYFENAAAYKEFDTGVSPVTQHNMNNQRIGLRQNNTANGGGGVDAWSLVHPENVIDGLTCANCTQEAVTGRLTENFTHRNLVAVGVKGIADIGVNLSGPYGKSTRLENVYLENWKTAIALPSVGESSIDGATFVNDDVDIVIDRGAGLNELTFNNVGTPKIRMRNYLTYLQRFENVYSSMQRIYLRDSGVEYVVFWKEQHPNYVLWNSSWPAIVAGKTNQQIYDEFGVAPSGCLSPPDAVDMGTYLLAPLNAANLVEAPIRSTRNLNGFFGGDVSIGTRTLQFNFAGADRVMAVDVVAGWQAVPIEFDGHKSSIFIRGIPPKL